MSLDPESVARNGVTFGPTHRAFWGWTVAEPFPRILSGSIQMADKPKASIQLEDRKKGT